MIDFTTLQGLTIPEGVVTQITDESGRVIWAVQSGEPIVLEVEKITSDTYAGETTYTAEEFILLNIYPKTNGTVNVTYGGLTKTITDTSGAVNPNAQQVFFGTFNGVSDEVTTPASGTLTIEGDYGGYGVCIGKFAKSSKSSSNYCSCVKSITDLGSVTKIFIEAFYGCTKITSVVIPVGVSSLGGNSFYNCTNLVNVTLPYTFMGFSLGNAFAHCSNLRGENVSISGNGTCTMEGNCLIQTIRKSVIAGFLDSVIPPYVESIGQAAFYGQTNLQSITIPASVSEISYSVFTDCTGLTSVTFENPNGWYVTTKLGGDISTGITVDLSNPTNNVTLLTDTYLMYYWYRS